MSYSYDSLAIDKTKVNYLQKCFYLINLIKTKSPQLWEKYKDQYEHTKPEDSWAFYQQLVEEYKKFAAAPVPEKKKAKLKVVAEQKVEKKAAKKVVKKAAPKKKAPAKKAPAKKAPAKKKSVKKAPAKKKAAKKTSKK